MDIAHIASVEGSDLLADLDGILSRVADDTGGNERIIVCHGGRKAAIVSLDDLEYLEYVDARLDARDAEEARRTLADPEQRPIPFVPSTSALPQRE